VKLRGLLLRWLVFGGLAVVVMLTAASAGAKKPKPPGGGGGGFSTTSTYVKNYGNVLGGVEYSLTPEDVQADSDGGWTALALTQSASGVGVSWLLKSSAVGAPQWQEEIGCLNGAPGDYADAVSLLHTSDGGDVLAGGTIGCGSGSDCPSLSGIQCGLIEKVDSSGHVVWAQVYTASPTSTAIDQIKPTSDGGFIAVGSATDVNHNPRALIVRLDAFGDIEWQQLLAPTGTGWALFNAVEQASDGGFVAVGEMNDGSQSGGGLPLVSVLAVKFDAAGNVSWQHGFNDVGPSGVTATEHALTVVQTSDGGYAIGGNWDSAILGPGSCCTGALLLKLTPSGSIQWQRAYSGGVSCSDQTCADIGGVVYSLHQTADGGYILAGDADSPQLAPWLAKVDGSGTLLWQQADYQLNPEYGTPLSEYFATSTITATGPLAIGSTENPSNGLSELLAVQTDANGKVGTCSQIHFSSTLSPTNPGLTAFDPGLATTTNAASQSSSPVQTQTTTTTATPSQC
jgi:hypothetical protein